MNLKGNSDALRAMHTGGTFAAHFSALKTIREGV